MAQHWYLHADLDAFFASVEQLDHPEYRGKPLIVGGLPSDPRSVVSTASYEARKYGVHSAMPTREAYRLCPNGIYIHGNYHRYEEMSWQIMQIFKRWSPDVQQMSIDEAFIDLTGTERLFGPPEETAMKIKKEVFEETGLTISIGLACTKYFAKLSSEINKPDGFYFMKPGTETDYMLSIPIEKIWGIGKKTAARIKDSGLKTTRQIYETDLSTLNFLYGENTAGFLYNILRGKADDMFGTEAKSHSISNERTFPYDITDAYACETALMELAHTVMFRLLRENLHSRTVVIKIRYDDFSTVSARQTYETDIITLDSFFEKVRDLFNRKFERTRGVRLLGVGFDNVHEEESTYQQDLFDDGQKKKQAVEKAILKIETKFPDLQVQKARVIKPKVKGILAFLFTAAWLSLAPAKLSALESSILDEADILPLPREAPEVLFDITRNDSRIEIFSSGYWKSEITESSAFTFGENNPTEFSFGVPIFKQEVNLDFRIVFNKQWFFNTAFAEQFKKNTVAFGFENGSIIKKAVLSNRNIVYPSDYSSDEFGFNPAGGSNQSPGFFMDLEGDKWKANFLFRYDITKQKEAIFYGSNQVTDSDILPGNYISGRFFSLPKEYLNLIENIYVENPDGEIKSKDGRKFKKLSQSQYSLNISEDLLIISREAAAYNGSQTKPYILVSFNQDNTLSKFLLETGAFSNPDSFLGKLQKLFSEKKNIKLENYWPKSEYNLEGHRTLILQTGKKFSPFENTSFYDGGLVSESDFIVRSKTTELQNENYEVNKTDINILFSGNDFFNEKHQYIKISQVSDQSDIQNRFPFSKENPEIYLSENYEGDISILMRNYSPVAFFQIPASASNGSVRAFVNGIQDRNASFDQDSGIVNLSVPFKDSDRIVITWNEEGTDLKSGAFTTAAGIKTDFTPFLKGDLDITSFWPVFIQEKHPDSEEALQGYMALNGGISYEKGFLKIQNKSSIAYENENVSGTYVIYSTSSASPETHYHSGNAATAITKINYISGSNLSDSVLCNGNSEKTISEIKDKEISGYAIPLELDFSEGGNKKSYTGCNIKVTDSLTPETFTLAIKPVFNNPSNLKENLELYLQLGTEGIREDTIPDEDSIPTWNISKLLDYTSNKWQEISVSLSEKDTVHLSEYKNLRLISVKKENVSPESVSGTLLIGPYEFQNKTQNIESSEGVITRSYSVENGKDLTTHISWDSISSSEDPYLCISDFFKASDFSSYNSINLDFKINNLSENKYDSDECNAFVITFFRNSEKVLEFGISDSILRSLISKNDEIWHTLSYNISEKCIYIDSTKVAEKDFFISEITKLIPNQFTLSINGYESGIIEIGKIYYKDNKPSFVIQNQFNSTLEKGPHSLFLQSNIKESINQKTSFYTDAAAVGKTNLLNVNISGDIKIKNSGTLLDSAGHSVSLVKPLFSVFDISENYRFSPNVKSAEKNRKAVLNFSKIKIPVSLSSESRQKENIAGYTGTSDSSLSVNMKYFSGKIFYQNKEQKNGNDSKASFSLLENSEYFSLYGLFGKNYFSFGDEKASLRDQNFGTDFVLQIPTADITPKISFNISDSYFSNTDFWFTDKETFFISFPFSIKQNEISLSWKKEAENTEINLSGGNYKSDTVKLFQNQKDRNYFYSTFPFADLFARDIKGNYISNYGLYWNRALSNSIKDLFLPSLLSFDFGRMILTDTNHHDYFQTKISFSNRAFNLFGKESSRQFFKWYSTDELTSSLEVITKTPFNEKENTLFSLSAYIQAMFFIKTGSSLKTATDCFIQTNSDWVTRQTVVFASQGKKSPLESLITLFEKDIKTEKNILRKETFNSEFGKSASETYESFAISHSCEVRFKKYYSVYTEAETSFMHKKNKGDTLGISLTLGGKMTY